MDLNNYTFAPFIVRDRTHLNFLMLFIKPPRTGMVSPTSSDRKAKSWQKAVGRLTAARDKYDLAFVNPKMHWEHFNYVSSHESNEAILCDNST